MNQPAATPMQSEVRHHRGAPRLFINGQIHTGASAFYRHDMHGNLTSRVICSLRDCGIGLFDINMTRGTPYEDQLSDDENFAQVEADIQLLLEHCPEATLLPRVTINAPQQWLEEHPDERALHLNPFTHDPVPHRRMSFASTKWRSHMAGWLKRYIRYFEQHHGDRIVGYHIGGGDCAEWAHTWENAIGDYSPAFTRGFRVWLRERYGNDVGRLRQAWADPAVAFESAMPARDRAKPLDSRMGHCALLDPAADGRLIDLLVYQSEVVADAAVHFCDVTQQTLADLGRKKIVGLFYGYHFWHFVGDPSWFHSSGHHAMQQVLEADSIDFLAAPHDYQDRQPGGFYLAQVPAGSLQLHGKLFFNEEDTPTHLAKSHQWGRAITADDSIQLLQRTFAGAMADAASQWWMNLGADADWYEAPQVQEQVRQFINFAEQTIETDRTPTAQVAVVVSEQSAAYLRHGCVTPAAVGMQMAELARIGAPINTYRVEDLDRLLDQPWSKQYRLVVMLDAFYLTEHQRSVIRDRLCRDGRTVLFCYACGLIGDDGWSAEAMGELTGFEFSVESFACPLRVNTWATGGWLTYGDSEFTGPSITAKARPGVEVLGDMVYPQGPGLVRQVLDGWTSVWSGALIIPAAVLRSLAADAGVHLFGDCGDQVFTFGRDHNPMGDHLAVHAGRSGYHRLRLTQAAALHDVFTGGPPLKTDADGHLEINLTKGETRIWRLAAR